MVSSNKQGAGAGLLLPEPSPQSSSSLTVVDSGLQLRRLVRPRCCVVQSDRATLPPPLVSASIDLMFEQKLPGLQQAAVDPSCGSESGQAWGRYTKGNEESTPGLKNCVDKGWVWRTPLILHWGGRGR